MGKFQVPVPSIYRPCTIYTRWIDELAGEVYIVRRVLKNCTSRNIADTVLANTGESPRNTRIIKVFHDPRYEYIPYTEWLTNPRMELHKYWSADFVPSGIAANSPRSPSLIVDREVMFEFDNPFPILPSGLPGQPNVYISPEATRAENVRRGTVTQEGVNPILGLARLAKEPVDKRDTATIQEAFISLNSNPSDL